MNMRNEYEKYFESPCTQIFTLYGNFRSKRILIINKCTDCIDIARPLMCEPLGRYSIVP